MTNPKSRFEVAIATAEDLRKDPTFRPDTNEFSHVGSHMTPLDKVRLDSEFSDISDAVIFVRSIGGHSKSSTIERAPKTQVLHPTDAKYLPPVFWHASPFLGMHSPLPGKDSFAEDSSREHVHFAPLHVLASNPSMSVITETWRSFIWFKTLILPTFLYILLRTTTWSPTTRYHHIDHTAVLLPRMPETTVSSVRICSLSAILKTLTSMKIMTV